MPTYRAPVLRQILLLMLLQAEANPGFTVSRRLTNNLRVEISIVCERIWLSISRSSVTPTRTEWVSVLRNWPYPLEVEPHEWIGSGRRYLRASWPSTHDT